MNTLPQWLKRPMPINAISDMNALLGEYKLNAVCKSARCPNIGECFQNKEITFMILGNVCTRNCAFCSVEKGIPAEPDAAESYRIAEAVKELNLKYVVITSVTRDDLMDGGAKYFSNIVDIVKRLNPGIKIEVLTPDFNNNISSLDTIIKAGPDVFAHNIETVPRLYGAIRPRARYKNSISLLRYVKERSNILIKSGFMLGLGESEDEVIELIEDLERIRVDIVTIGQYLRPDKNCLPVKEFLPPEKFIYFKEKAVEMGIPYVSAGPFVRSSYKAEEAFEEAKRCKLRFPIWQRV